MDPPTVVKTFKHNAPQQQQPISNSVSEQTPLHFRSFSQNKTSISEETSFSSNLKPKENDDNTEISIFDAQKYFCENSGPEFIKTQQQKKEPSTSHDILPSLSSVSFGRNSRTRSFHATPTASSEASWNSPTRLLVNPPGSDRVSMKNFSPGGDNTNSKKIKRNSSSVARKWFFGLRSCCSGKKSVRVEEVTTSDSDHRLGQTIENKNGGKCNILCAKSDSHKAKALCSTSDHHHIMGIHQNKIMPQNPLDLPSSPENGSPASDPPRQQWISASGGSFVDGTGGFSFPILKNPVQVVKPGSKGVISKGTISPLEEDPPRDSLEFFQPTDNPVSARRRFNLGSPIACVASTDDDLGSDASSDLFEIESFATQTASYTIYRRRDSLDEAPIFDAGKHAPANGINLNNNNNNNVLCDGGNPDEPSTSSVAASECYAPTEASINWRVTTAEGFDRASVSNLPVSASEVDRTAFFRQNLQEEDAGCGGKRKGNGGGLLLMSCRQEKAVNVGPQSVKCLPVAEGGGGPPVFASHVGGRPPRANKRTTLGNDHSASLSLAFAA